MAAELGVPVTLLVGCITSLWAKMSAHAKRGDLEKISEKVVEAWARWDGAPGAFYAAFASRFIRNGRVKNWDHYNGKSIRDAELDAKRKREARRRKFLGLSGGRPADAPPDVLRTGGRTDETDETDETDVKKKRKKTARESPEDPLFEQAWSRYPKRPNNSKPAAMAAWRRSVKAGVDPAAMLQGVDAYAAYVAREQTPPNFVRMASTFFGPQRHWESDYGPAPSRTVKLYDDNGEPTPEIVAMFGLQR